MQRRHPITANGAQALRVELSRLKTQERPQIIKAIAEARAHGDLKENSEYIAAKERQSFIEGRIIELESKLSRAQIIDVTKIPNNGRVIFGCTVHLQNLETKEEMTYQIVCEDEADIKSGKISFTSPIARALIGKNVGESVSVETPESVIDYIVGKVEHI
jgi:transcription elongation factor GreA